MRHLNRVHLSGLRAAEAVIRHGSLAGAAGELEVSVGAVSQRIARLEQALGRRLFDRHAAGMTPTALGRDMAAPLNAGFGQLSAALDGSLDQVDYRIDGNFGFAVPVAVDGVESAILDPRSTWADKQAYDASANRLVTMFIDNFAKFEAHVDGSVLDAAPGFKAAAE